jgi:hypothetical protein
MSLLLWAACGGAEAKHRDAGSAEADAGGNDTALDDGGDAAQGAQCAACTECEESVNITSATHRDEDLVYTDLPPAGGDHHPCWVDFGVYDVEVPDERWVHNLEHGGVAFLYHCPDGCDAELEALDQLVRGRTQALLTPYAGLPKRFAAVSWGHRLVVDCFNAEQFEAFYEAHVDRAPESIADGPGSPVCN